MATSEYSHSLLPIGYKTQDDKVIIYVYDCNQPNIDGEMEFHLQGNEVLEWSYKHYNGTNDTFSIDAHSKIYCRNIWLSTGSLGFFSWLSNNTPISQSKLLIKSIIANPKTKQKLSQMLPIIGENTDQEQYYWVLDSETDVEFLDCSRQNTITVIDEYTGVEFAAEGDLIRVTVDDNGENSIRITGTSNESISMSFTVTNENGELTCVNINGVPYGNVVAYEDNNDIKVEGLNDIYISYSISDEEQSNTLAPVVDGRMITITIDEANETVSTDFVEETSDDPTDPETPTDPEMPAEPGTPAQPANESCTICKYCGADHGNSFFGRLVAFFHSIFYFFSHLFGKM